MSFDTYLERLEKKIEETIVKNTFVFSSIDIHLAKVVDNLLLFRIFCHCFFCVTGSKSFRKCDVCSIFFVDDSVIASKINQEFLLSKNGIPQLRICGLMEQVNARSVVLNLYYLVREWQVMVSGLKTFEKYFLKLQLKFFVLRLHFLPANLSENVF